MQNFRQIGRSALLFAGFCLALCPSMTAAAQTPGTSIPPSSVRQPSAGPSSTARTSVPATAPPSATASAAVQRVRVLGGQDAVEIEVEGSGRLTPQTQVLTGPDRLVVDFPNALPGAQLRNQSVNRGEVKDVRVGLFHSQPPVTRLVLDLKAPQPFQIFPGGKTVIIKVSGKAQVAEKVAPQGVEDFPPMPAVRPAVAPASYTAGAERIGDAAVAPLTLDVTFRNGLLSIKSSKASLSEILFAVHQRTGADVTLSPGAEQEKVAADLGPAPAPEVLTKLLNGSKFNYLIVSSPNDSRELDKVILSPKAVGAVTPLPPMTNESAEEAPASLPLTQPADATTDNPPAGTTAPSTTPPPTNAIPNMAGTTAPAHHQPSSAPQPPDDNAPAN